MRASCLGVRGVQREVTRAGGLGLVARDQMNMLTAEIVPDDDEVKRLRRIDLAQAEQFFFARRPLPVPCEGVTLPVVWPDIPLNDLQHHGTVLPAK